MKSAFCYLAALAGVGMVTASGQAAEEPRCHLDMIAQLPATVSGDGVSIPARLNGQDERVVLDSGDFLNSMSGASATERGLKIGPLPGNIRLTGKGGPVAGVIYPSFEVAGLKWPKLEFVVQGASSGQITIGANWLATMTSEFDLASGSVRFFRESGCDKANLAYWARGATVNVVRMLGRVMDFEKYVFVEVSVNDHPMRALLKTATTASILTRHAALSAGIDLNSPQAVASERVGVVGNRRRTSWIVRVPSIGVGGEDIRNTPIRVIDDRDEPWPVDMILGLDFLMAHHVLIAPARRLVFLTYNGGPIFSTTTDGEIGHVATRSESIAPSSAPAPADPAGLKGRASARLLQGDGAGALADYSAAIALAPADADALARRADANRQLGHADAGVKDLDAALALKPNDPVLLVKRGWMRLEAGDKDGARRDAAAAGDAAPKGGVGILPAVQLLERLGQAEQAIGLLSAAIGFPHDGGVFPELLEARAWNRALANRDIQGARQDIEAAMGKAGPTQQMLATRGLVRFRQGDFAGAIADESAAQQKGPNRDLMLYLRGLARLAEGDALGGKADIDIARSKIGDRYAAYGLTAP